MAWEFSTEPEFQARLDWMREFVREEIWPLETLAGELTQEELDRLYAPRRSRRRSRRAACGRRTCRRISAARASGR
jgi:acyl-CoA dehydrogenase